MKMIQLLADAGGAISGIAGILLFAVVCVIGFLALLMPLYVYMIYKHVRSIEAMLEQSHRNTQSVIEGINNVTKGVWMLRKNDG